MSLTLNEACVGSMTWLELSMSACERALVVMVVSQHNLNVALLLIIRQAQPYSLPSTSSTMASQLPKSTSPGWPQ